MSAQKIFFLVLLVGFMVSGVVGQASTDPHIGFLYPAGGQQGTTVQITAGGQFLRGTTDVFVSGEGVSARVVQYIRPLRNIQREQRELLISQMREISGKRIAELTGKPYVPPAKNKKEPAKKKDDKTPEVKLPEHPLLFNLEEKSLRELAHVRSILFFPRYKQQLNRQLAEMVVLEITIDPDARPGNREIRLKNRLGLTNPVIFQVGTMPEVGELEPNNQAAFPKLQNFPNLEKIADLLKDMPLDLPVTLNGQILPGDIDRFRFRARQGQKLVIKTEARSLIPYLADAVPGWFQATVAVYDSQGNELAFADDFRFDPDPVMLFEVPKNDEYELEIRDAIYRGREDFVYRVSIGQQPFITEVYPLGGPEKKPLTASINGWNLTETKLELDTRPSGDFIRRADWYDGSRCSNAVLYAVDNLPESQEKEGNDSIKNAQSVELPVVLNGRIEDSEDVDVFHFQGHAGDKIVAEVLARRLNSPLDSLVRLTDAAGNIMAWNDDHVLKDNHLHKDISGLITHHADSCLTAELPRSGNYYIHLFDTRHHGSSAHAYRLRLTPPQIDFALRVTPSSLNVRAGHHVPICVHALRKNGYDGPIEVVLKDAPRGFKLTGGIIPANRERICMTLLAPNDAPAEPVSLRLEGLVHTPDQTIRRSVVPADDVMQAFLYRHLVPAQEFLVAVENIKWRTPPIEIAGRDPVRIAAGSTGKVLFKTPRRGVLKELKLELKDPPEGVSLDDVKVVPEGLAVRLKVEKDAVEGFYADNLIVEAFREFYPKQKDGTLSKKLRRYSMGILPAVPVEIVQ